MFSVGSINWFCSLAWDAYQNNIARLTANVLRGFARRAEEKERGTAMLTEEEES